MDGRGQHPNSKKNLEKGRKTRFNGETAAKAGKKGARISNAKQKQMKTLAQLARIVGEADVKDAAIREQLARLGIDPEDMTNNALILAAVFQAAMRGDMKAIEKWEQYIGQGADAKDSGNVEIIIDV